MTIYIVIREKESIECGCFFPLDLHLFEQQELMITQTHTNKQT